MEENCLNERRRKVKKQWNRRVKMENLGKRLNYARKKNGYTQDSLAEAIGVSRGVIYNLENNKTIPKTIVLNAICKTLRINKDWLLNGTGNMDNISKTLISMDILAELNEAAGKLSEDELLYVLDIVKALQQRLNGEK